jgi:hypothetical protein
VCGYLVVEVDLQASGTEREQARRDVAEELLGECTGIAARALPDEVDEFLRGGRTLLRTCGCRKLPAAWL